MHFRPFDLSDQEFDRLLANFFNGLVDSRKARHHERCKRDIVIPDDLYILRNASATSKAGLNNVGSLQVTCKNTVHVRVFVKKFVHKQPILRKIEDIDVGLYHHGLCSSFLRFIQECVAPQIRQKVECQIATEIRDLGTTSVQKVARSEPSTLVVVAADKGYAVPNFAVEGNNRHKKILVLIHVEGMARHDDPIDFVPLEHLHIVFFFLTIQARFAKQNLVAVLVGCAIDGGDEFSKKRMHRRRNNDAENARFFSVERAGDFVGHITELIHN